VIVDGSLIACDRVAADRTFYSGKYQLHGMNIQVVAAPDGHLLWTFWSLPGPVEPIVSAAEAISSPETASPIAAARVSPVRSCPRREPGR